MHTLKLFPALLLLTTCLPTLCAQPSAPAKPFELTLPVAAHDKKGAPVTSLKPADLTLTDEGKPQSILNLSHDAGPFRIGLLVQTTRTLGPSLEPYRKAASTFVESLLPASGSEAPNQLFLIHFDRQVELLQDFSSSRARLLRELEQMGPSPARTSPRSQGPERTGDERNPMPRGNSARAGNPNLLYDAIYLSATELMAPTSGRRALVLVSDGVDSGSKVTLNQALDAALRANLAVYTIYLKSEQDRSFLGSLPGVGSSRGGYPGSSGGGYPGGGGGYPGGQRRPTQDKPAVDGKKILERIAQRTGGMLFEAKKNEQLPEIHTRLAAELLALSWLTFRPDPLVRDGGFHKLALKPSAAGLEVALPEGYFAPEN